MGIVLEPHLRSVTHILSSPLSRCLESACLTFKSAIERGVKVCAVPELQSMGILPNGTGLSLQRLKESYEGTDVRGRFGERVREWCGDEIQNGTDTSTFHQGKRDMRAFEGRVFKGQIDFGFMREDWNNPEEKRDGTDGRYVGIASRLGFIRGFLKGLQTGCRGRERLKVVVVTHSSLIREWVVDGTASPNPCPLRILLINLWDRGMGN
jgi:broad specificity phosphatase PhoE